MTETTSIQHFMRESHSYAPFVRKPGLPTFIAQASIGSFCGSYLVLFTRMLSVPASANDDFIFYQPFFMAFGLATGTVAGFLIWVATREADGQLPGITRSLIGVLVVALAWFAGWYYLLRDEITPDINHWLLALVVVSGLSLGSITGSRLRPWRELVRAGETRSTFLKIIAGFIGLVLRVVIIFSLLAGLAVAVTDVRLYYQLADPPLPIFPRVLVWWLFLLGHFALGMIVLFARMRFWRLVLLTVVAVSPVLASLWLVNWVPIERNFILGYLGLWAMFLLTRWRQTDIAWSYLKEELRYYLID